MRGDGAGHAPTRISAAIAVGAAGVATTTAVDAGWGLLAPLGAVVFSGGLWWRHGTYLALGCALLFAAAFATGLAGGSPVLLAMSVAATFVAWDLGEYAMVLGDQLGRRAETRRLELLHAAGSVAVATVGVSGPYAVFSLAGRGQPLSALILLLVGTTTLLAVLRRY